MLQRHNVVVGAAWLIGTLLNIWRPMAILKAMMTIGTAPEYKSWLNGRSMINICISFKMHGFVRSLIIDVFPQIKRSAISTPTSIVLLKYLFPYSLPCTSHKHGYVRKTTSTNLSLQLCTMVTASRMVRKLGVTQIQILLEWWN